MNCFVVIAVVVIENDKQKRLQTSVLISYCVNNNNNLAVQDPKTTVIKLDNSYSSSWYYV